MGGAGCDFKWGWWRGLQGKVTFQQRHEAGVGTRLLITWGRAFQAEGRASAEASRQEAATGSY